VRPAADWRCGTIATDTETGKRFADATVHRVPVVDKSGDLSLPFQFATTQQSS
jgi:hypothetical protein